MFRRGDRDRLAGGIDAGRKAGRRDIGEFFREGGADRFRRVEKGAAPGGDFGEDAARHDVARGKLGVLVQGGHEAFARAIDQNGAFAAQGFGRQRRGVAADIDGGWMELHEFGVSNARPGARRKGQSRAIGLRRIGGQGVKRADAAAGENGGTRREGAQGAGGVASHNPGDAAGLEDQILGDDIFMESDGGRAPDTAAIRACMMAAPAPSPLTRTMRRAEWAASCEGVRLPAES